jgi:hypothetical protein
MEIRDHCNTNMRPKEMTFFVGEGKKLPQTPKKFLHFFKRAQLILFGKYAVTKKFSSSEGKPDRQTNYDDFIRLFVDITQAEQPWEKRHADWQYFSCPNKCGQEFP